MNSGVGILLAIQRSGTNALGSILSKIEGMKYLGEVFHASSRNFLHPDNFFNFFLSKIKEQPERYLYKFFSDNPKEVGKILDEFFEYLKERYSSSFLILDIKYNSTHLFNGGWHFPTQYPKLILFIKEKNIPIIHLKRNLFRVYISELVALKTGKWHITDVSEKRDMENIKLEINIKEAENFIKLRYKSLLLIEEALVGYNNLLNIKYAELFDKFGNTNIHAIKKITKFLGLSDEVLTDIKPDYVKSITEPKDIVVNYDEVISYFYDKEWFRDMELLCGSIEY